MIITETDYFQGKATKWKVAAEVTSDSGSKYLIERHVRTGKVRCTCPHFRFRLFNTGRLCKHLVEYDSEAESVISVKRIA